MSITQIITVGFAGMAMWANAGVVSNVNVSNRYPWNGMVDVKFNLSQDAAVTLTALDKVGGTNLTMKALSEAGVPMQNGLTCLSAGDRHVVWNAATDYPNAVFENVEISVTTDEKLYMVINLTKSGGKYPVTYLAGAPNAGWPIEYKTKYLVLRRISAGSFVMGLPDRSEPKTIGSDYYIGIFEVTYGQLWRVTNAQPSTYGWSPEYPANIQDGYDYRNGVEGSFNATLTEGIGKTVRLPTEAEWEYACRAGTTTRLYTGCTPASIYELRIELAGRENFYNGGGSDARLRENEGRLFPVGILLPNPWGLYDMYGNRAEACSDVCKGGSFASKDATIGSSYRGSGKPSDLSSDKLGFRVVVTP